MWNEFFIDEGNREDTQVFSRGDGYSYHRNRTVRNHVLNGVAIYLRCIKRRTEQCHGTAQVLRSAEDDTWLDGTPHTCNPDHLSRDVRMLRREVLQECRTNVYEPARRVLHRISAWYDVEVSARVRLPNMRQSMHRARTMNFPNLPHSLEELANLLEDANHHDLTRTSDGTDNFYLATVGPPGHRSVIFASQRMLRFLSSVKAVFADATFTPTPGQLGARQLFQIVTVLRGKVIPIVQAIMERKSYEAYRAILVHLQQQVPRFHPRTVVVDFEVAEMTAWMDVYVHCAVVGCYVHYVRANLRHLGTLGLIPLMRENRLVNTIIYMLLSIPHLPKPMIRRGFLTVIRLAQRRQQVFNRLKPFLQYFAVTWASGIFYRVLSVYGQAHRTNNAVESAHRILRYDTGPHHPSIWTYLAAVRTMEHNAYADVRAAVQGLPLGTRRRPAVIYNDNAIKNHTVNLLGGTIKIRRFLLRCSNTILNLVENQ